MLRKNILSALCAGLCLMISSVTMTGCKSSAYTPFYFDNADQTIVGQSLPEYGIRVKPGDELRVIVSSSMPEATAMYNLPPYTQNTSNSGQLTQETRIVTYVVSPSGNITMPVLGDLNVAGKTTDEIKQMIFARVSEQVKDPIVSVEFTHYYITVLGEVAGPKRFSVSNQRFSILDAIGNCGGIRLTGISSRVRLIREEDGRIMTHLINLQDADLVNSPYYYMQQNDVLIVDANDVAKSNALYNQHNGFRLSVVSTCVSAISVIASLLIAFSK